MNKYICKKDVYVSHIEDGEIESLKYDKADVVSIDDEVAKKYPELFEKINGEPIRLGIDKENRIRAWVVVFDKFHLPESQGKWSSTTLKPWTIYSVPESMYNLFNADLHLTDYYAFNIISHGGIITEEQPKTTNGEAPDYTSSIESLIPPKEKEDITYDSNDIATKVPTFEDEEDEQKEDMVNHPSHYTWLKEKCGIEVIDITRHLDFDIGNAVKYLLRHGHKPEKGLTIKKKAIQDLEKAIFYIKDKIEQIKKEW